jgi:hypothetical protein
MFIRIHHALFRAAASTRLTTHFTSSTILTLSPQRASSGSPCPSSAEASQQLDLLLCSAWESTITLSADIVRGICDRYTMWKWTYAYISQLKYMGYKTHMIDFLVCNSAIVL